MASKSKVTPQKEEMLEQEGPETPLLDRSNAPVKALIRTARKRGYVTHDQINSLMIEINSEQIENVLAMFSEMGINVVESEEAETEEAAAEEVRARRAHRRSRAHVPARNGLSRASLPRGRNRHC
jgi:RNA polymerase primary sigma factor